MFTVTFWSQGIWLAVTSLRRQKRCQNPVLRLIVKITYFVSGYVMVVIDCIMCAPLDKILQSRLHVISGLCKTHCQQVPEFSCQLLIIYVPPHFRQRIHTYNSLQFQPKRLKWVVHFGYSFLGPLLQSGHLH